MFEPPCLLRWLLLLAMAAAAQKLPVRQKSHVKYARREPCCRRQPETRADGSVEDEDDYFLHPRQAHAMAMRFTFKRPLWNFAEWPPRQTIAGLMPRKLCKMTLGLASFRLYV